MSGYRLHLSSLTKMLVTVFIASSACCETAVQQRLSCFMFTDSRDQEESKLLMCSTIRPIDWFHRAFAASISHTIQPSVINPGVFFTYQSPPRAFALSCARYKISAIYIKAKQRQMSAENDPIPITIDFLPAANFVSISH